MSWDDTQTIHKASVGTFSSSYRGRNILMQSHRRILSMRPSDIYTPHRVEPTKSFDLNFPEQELLSPAKFLQRADIYIPSKIL